jgi:hypothetical protein
MTKFASGQRVALSSRHMLVNGAENGDTVEIAAPSIGVGLWGHHAGGGGGMVSPLVYTTILIESKDISAVCPTSENSSYYDIHIVSQNFLSLIKFININNI